MVRFTAFVALTLDYSSFKERPNQDLFFNAYLNLFLRKKMLAFFILTELFFYIGAYWDHFYLCYAQGARVSALPKLSSRDIALNL